MPILAIDDSLSWVGTTGVHRIEDLVVLRSIRIRILDSLPVLRLEITWEYEVRSGSLMSAALMQRPRTMTFAIVFYRYWKILRTKLQISRS